MKFFCIPSDFKLNTVKELYKLNQKSEFYKVKELYGQCTTRSIIPSGRNSVPNIDLNDLKAFIKEVHKYGLKFNYVINGSTLNNSEFSKHGLQEIINFLKELEDCKVDAVTMSVPSLLEIIEDYGFDFDIVVSTINQVNTVDTAQYYESKNVKRIVFSETINRNFKMLKAITSACKCDFEIIVNSLCYINCPLRMYHYNQIAQCAYEKNDIATSYYSNRCFMRRQENPVDYLRNAFIRPEDMKLYEELDIKYFKIQGRNLIKNADIIRTLETYFSNSYDGNLYDLLNCFSQSDNTIYIDNKSLNDFIGHFVKGYDCDLGCRTCNHCNKYFELSCRSNTFKNKFIGQRVKEQDPFSKLLEGER